MSNIEKAKEYAKQFVRERIPFYSPHLNLSLVTVEVDEDTSDYAIPVHKTFFEKCDVLAVLPGWQESTGTKEEIEMAKRRGMQTFYLDESDVINQIKKQIQ